MNRSDALERLADSGAAWDVIVIGGGATGLGAAMDSASRGYDTVLLEQHDFAKATSSRSTKLIHGGFRYLKQGNVSLVRESLRERGLLLRNAPHLVQPLAFVVPAYHWWERAYYGAGLKLYDAMAGRLGLGPSRLLSRAETLRLLPTLEPAGLRGGVRYFDGQFDDARLAVCLARTLFDHGGIALNYVRVVRLLKEKGRVCGVVARDEIAGREFTVLARVVVNATGIFTDEVRWMDEPQASRMMTVSQGAHLVLDRSFLPGDTAVMVPKTDDGRILFAIPWQNRVLVGTTDTPMDAPSLEPKPLPQEVDFLLKHAGRYLCKAPAESDILSMFAGLRPLAKAGDHRNTSRISRDHVLTVSPSGLITITGGKWTTCRKMAEDAVDAAIKVGGMEWRPCKTRTQRLFGVSQSGEWTKPNPADPPHWNGYGQDWHELHRLAASFPKLNETLHPRLPHRAVEVVWAVRYEMAMTVEDVLARRLRALALDARASLEMAPRVADLMAGELGRDDAWRRKEVESFSKVAVACLPAGGGL